jgi:accessory colonization factor AcfC
MKELAAAYARAKGTTVEIVAGPTNTWLAQAKADAHIVFSGSESMMTGFVAAFEDQLQADTIDPLYLRPATLLVRKGNPKGIKGLRDVAKPGVKLIVTEGAGQVGMWEDVAGRSGEIGLLKGIRANIVENAANSALARKSWVEKPDIDAWLIWNHWQIANPDIADQVAIEPELTIWRATSIAITKRGAAAPEAKAFAAFIASAEGEAVFRKWGWRR